MNVINATFTNTTGAEVLINRGTAREDRGHGDHQQQRGPSVDIQNRTGGTVTFTGAITDTGQGSS